MDNRLYEADFVAWTAHQARLLREGPRNSLDWDHLAEEIEGLGRAERRALVSQLTRLIAHLLKWRYQPTCRDRSWVASILNAQDEVRDVLADNPSLSAGMTEAMATAWRRGRTQAIAETDLPPEAFPEDLPWTFEAVMAPGGPDGSVTWD